MGLAWAGKLVMRSRAGLGTQMDLYMLPSLLERPIEWVRRECLHSSIMKVSVGSKRAVEDTVTDGPLYNYSSAVHFSVSSYCC